MTSLANNYKRRKISFKNGKGSFLNSTRGKKYLDFVQGIAVNSLGHSNPYLSKALKKQVNKVWHVSNAFLIPEGEKLAKRLSKYTFAEKIIFQNSGAEATEAAIKVARKYFFSIGKKEKRLSFPKVEEPSLFMPIVKYILFIPNVKLLYVELVLIFSSYSSGV